MWSSARSHVFGEKDAVLTKDCYLVKEINDWSGYLRQKEDREAVEDIRKNTRTGRPCGDEVFNRKIEGIIGKRLMALPHGRPRINK